MSHSAQDVRLDALLAQVGALRGDVVPRVDPVHLHYMEALARRLQAAPPSLQKVLQAKLEDALKAVNIKAEMPLSFASVAPVEAPAAPQKPRKPKTKTLAETGPATAPVSLLGQLNQHLHTASRSAVLGAPDGARFAHPQDLRSTIRFRETWARISAETEVDKAAHRAPENAGPLNAHNLVLRTLALMREFSPDYLRRFMSHTESLLWLDQAYGQLKQPVGKARVPKAGKPKA